MSKDDMFATWRALPQAERSIRLEQVEKLLDEGRRRAKPEDASGMAICEILVAMLRLEALDPEELDRLLDEEERGESQPSAEAIEEDSGSKPVKVAFERYISLGDSISIDEYPGRAWQELKGLSAPRPGLGAASLLHSNDEEAWPDFRGRDLRSCCPGITFDCLATDGGTTADVLDNQLPQLEGHPGPALVTLTVGGNDLLRLLSSGQPPTTADAEAILRDVAGILDRLEQLYPAGTVLLGTVYDPTDGDSALMGIYLGRAERAALARVNDGLRQLAAERERVVLADIAAHFSGHGLTAGSDDRWYWPQMPIEPSARGASEVRRVWLRSLREVEPSSA